MMGDRIAILRPGGGSPSTTRPRRSSPRPPTSSSRTSSAPTAASSASSLTRLDELPLEPLDGARGPALAGSTTLRDALSLMLSEGSRVVVVLGGDGAPRGSLSLDALADRLSS